jgi:hypothetical protein
MSPSFGVFTHFVLRSLILGASILYEASAVPTPSSLISDTCCSLPLLSHLACRSLVVDGLKTLLLKHGHKLRDLELRRCQDLPIFEMCPSLNVFSFVFDPMVGSSLFFSALIF